MKTLEQITEILSKMTGREPPKPQQPLFYDAMTMSDERHQEQGGYGLDSLDRLELVMELEETFEIEIPDSEVDDNEELNTAEGIAAFVDAKVEKG